MLINYCIYMYKVLQGVLLVYKSAVYESSIFQAYEDFLLWDYLVCLLVVQISSLWNGLGN